MPIKLSLIAFLFLITPTLIFAVNEVEINTATLEQLNTLTGIGDVKAQAIIDARPFSSVDDLLRVKGIGEKTLQKIKDQGLAYVEGQIQQPAQEVNQTQPVIQPVTPSDDGANPIPKKEPTEVRPSLTYPSGIILNEILPSPEGADEQNEWIEIYNQNATEIDLSGWKLYDTEGSSNAYIFPLDSKIQSKGYLVLKRPITKITLNNTKDGIKIENPGGIVSDEISYIKAPTNQSYNRLNSVWAWSKTLTPGSKNIISTESGISADATPQKNETIGGENLLASLEQGIPEKKNFTITLLVGIIISILLVISFYFLKTKLTNSPEGEKNL